jgi:hypothetical protein
MSQSTIDVTLLEVAKAFLRDAFVCAQPAVTCAVKVISVRLFGACDWLVKFKCHIGASMQAFAVDDRRAFDV